MTAKETAAEAALSVRAEKQYKNNTITLFEN